MQYCKDCQLYECAMRTPLGGCGMTDTSQPKFIAKEIPFTEKDESRYWELYRREAAKDILAVAYSSTLWKELDTVSIVRASIQTADELINQLKEKQHENRN